MALSSLALPPLHLRPPSHRSSSTKPFTRSLIVLPITASVSEKSSVTPPFLIKPLNQIITSSAQRGWFCRSSSSTCPESKYDDSSSHDDTSDSEIDISECPYAYENPFVQRGSRKLFELDMYPHEARVRLDLPGVDSSGIEVFFRDDFLMVRGEELPPTPERRAYAYSIKLRQTELLKKEETRAEFQNGVLRVIIPKHVPQEEEEENNEKDGVKVTGSITSPVDVPVSLKLEV